MVYKLTITEHTDELLDNILYYLIYQLKNELAATHLLDEINIIYERFEGIPKGSVWKHVKALFLAFHLKFRMSRMTIFPFFDNTRILSFRFSEKASYFFHNIQYRIHPLIKNIYHSIYTYNVNKTRHILRIEYLNDTK